MGWEKRTRRRRKSPSVCPEGTIFPSAPLEFSLAELIIELIQDRLTGEKETNFNLCSQMSHRGGQRKQLLYFLDREITHS